MEMDKSCIGSLIRELRKSMGMTQMGLAKKMGITYQQVQKYEKGISELTLRRFGQIAEAFGVSPLDFFKKCIGEKRSKRVPMSDFVFVFEQEKEVLEAFRKLNPEAKKVVLDLFYAILKRKGGE